MTDQELVEEVVSAIQSLETVGGRVGEKRIAEAIIPIIAKREREKVLREQIEWLNSINSGATRLSHEARDGAGYVIRCFCDEQGIDL